MDCSAIGQQIVDARNFAAMGQPSSALVYYEALLPPLARQARCCVGHAKVVDCIMLMSDKQQIASKCSDECACLAIGLMQAPTCNSSTLCIGDA